MIEYESYICLKCGTLAGFDKVQPENCFKCNSNDWISVDRYVETWPESFKL